MKLKKKRNVLIKNIMEKLKPEGECYFNLNITNFTSDDLIEKDHSGIMTKEELS